MNSWLAQRAGTLAATGGVDRAGLDLSDADVDTLLDLARIAAHESGDRRNAPLLCYLAGLAQARGSAGLDELAEAVRSSSS